MLSSTWWKKVLVQTCVTKHSVTRTTSTIVRQRNAVNVPDGQRSHRPDVVFQEQAVPSSSRSCRRRLSFPAGGSETRGSATRQSEVNEVEVHPLEWAIRLFPERSAARCLAWFPPGSTTQSNDGMYCKKPISPNGNRVPAPSFYGTIRYTDRQTGIEHSKQQFMWFCRDTTLCCNNVRPTITVKPIQLPTLWPISVNCNLSSDEAMHLRSSGFKLANDLVFMGTGTPERCAAAGPSNNIPRPPSGPLACKVPLSPSGKQILTRTSMSKLATKSLQEAEALAAAVKTIEVVERAVKERFLVEELSTLKSFWVEISNYPTCTCEEFVKNIRRSWSPCKHMYFIYKKTLGVDARVAVQLNRRALSNLEVYNLLIQRSE